LSVIEWKGVDLMKGSSPTKIEEMESSEGSREAASTPARVAREVTFSHFVPPTHPPARAWTFVWISTVVYEKLFTFAFLVSVQ
jgi:hypothetical protein